MIVCMSTNSLIYGFMPSKNLILKLLVPVSNTASDEEKEFSEKWMNKLNGFVTLG